MANPDKIPGGGATEAETGGELGKGFAALADLYKKAAEGDEGAKLALEIIEDMQLGVQAGLKTQIEIEAHRGILKALTGGGAKAQEPKP